MLGIGGKFASSKGMVLVPSLIGLTPSQADQAILSAGLVRGNPTTVETSTISLGGRVDQQSVAAGTLIDYESLISYRSLVYVAPPAPAPEPIPPVITYGSCEVYSQNTNPGFCSGTQTCQPSNTNFRRRSVFADGVFSGYDYSCSSTSTGGGCSFVDGSCGYSAPVVCNGTPGSNTYTSSCSGGQYFITTRSWDACGKEIRVTNFFSCCTAGLVSCTSWSGSAGGQSRVCTYRRSDCSTYTVTETRCAATTSTSCGSCVRIGGLVGSYKSCTTTTTTTSCTTSRTTSSVKC